MAITVLGLTGFEYGIANVNGSGIATTVSTNATVGTTTPRNGAYRLRVAAPGSAASRFRRGGLSGTKVVIRFGMQVAIRPVATNTVQVAGFLTAGAVPFVITVDNNGVLGATCGGTAVTGPTIDTTNYHLIELQCDCSTLNAYTLDWKVDGVLQTRATNGAAAASTLSSLHLGTEATTEVAFTCNYDDWIYGTWTVASTDWFGDGKILAQVPGSDGTHSTPADFSPGDAGTQYTGTPTTAWTQVHPDPWTATRSSTVNIAQRVAAAAYMEIAPAPTSEAGTANAVVAYMAYSSSTTAANTATAVVRSSAGVDISLLGTVATPAAWNVSTNNFKSALVTKPAAGWTATEVNAILWRFGWSNDIAPVPTAQAFMIEVDWPVAAIADLGAVASSAVAAAVTLITAAAMFSSTASSSAAATASVTIPSTPPAIVPVAVSSSAASAPTVVSVAIAPTAASSSTAAAPAVVSVAIAPTVASSSSATAAAAVPMAITPTAASSSSTSAPVTAAVKLSPTASSTATATATVTSSSAPSIVPVAASSSAASSPTVVPVAITPSAASSSTATSPVGTTASIIPTAASSSSATAPITAALLISPVAAGTSAAIAPVVVVVKVVPVGSSSSAAASPVLVSPSLSPTASSTSAASSVVTATSFPQITPIGISSSSATTLIRVSVGIAPAATATGQASAIATTLTVPQISPAAISRTSAVGQVLTAAPTFITATTLTVGGASTLLTAPKPHWNPSSDTQWPENVGERWTQNADTRWPSTV